MSDEPTARSTSEKTQRFSRQVGAKAARKLKAQRHIDADHLVRLGHDGADRLVGGGADAARRGARLWLDKHYPGSIPGRSCCWSSAWSSVV